MRMSMARSVMRLGPVHVVVVAPSAALRGALASWLRANKRVRLVRSAASAAELGGHAIDCDLVVASALEGTRELRALSRRFGRSAGLVALSLGTAPLPAGWIPVGPGAARDHVLDHAVAHPERSVAASSTVLASIVVALVAVLVGVVWVPETSVSFDRAAMAYAARFPDTGTWWHIWGAGAPYLASASWPLLKLAALAGGGPEVFVLLAGAVSALYGVSFLLLALRAGARGYAVVAALAAMLPPALWVWPRGGDVASLAGLAGVVLALAGTQVGRMRILTIAVAVAVSAVGGYPWVLAAALAAAIGGIRARRGRASIAGAILGTLLSTAVTLPPLLSRGLEGLRPPLARAAALSDLAPVLVSAALIGVILMSSRGGPARGRVRALVVAAAAVVVIASNALAFAVPVPELSVPRVPSTGAHGRLAVHPAQALALAAVSPDLPTTGDAVTLPLILGTEPKDPSNTHLEWLGVDRALLPDRSSAVIFNERDWPVLDRERLLFSAPRVRPILTAGITPTMLVVADEPDARVFGEALIQLGIPSDVVVPVVAGQQLEQLTRDTLREFTMVVVYGRPWTDVATAEAVLDDYLQLSGFVFWDSAGRAGAQPLVGAAQTVRADDANATGPRTELVTATGFSGRATAIDRFVYRADPGWEQAALAVGNKRVIQYGQTVVAGDTGIAAAHMVWSGADLPARAAAGDERALGQLRQALLWMLSDAGVTPTGGYGIPESGDVLDNELATTTFKDPTRWRVELKAATTGLLFKQRFHGQWRAFQVETQGLSGMDTRTSLKIRPTTHGYMYVTLPPNARTVEFVFERHPFEAAGRGVSAIALFITIGITFFVLRQ